MNNFKSPYVKNGPLLSLVDGHYPCFREIKGLDFTISIVMSATNLTEMDGIHREIQAQRLVDAWNMHDPLTDELATARMLLSEARETADELQATKEKLSIACTLLAKLIDIEGPQPGTAEWAEDARALLAGAAPSAIDLATAAILSADAHGQVLTVTQRPRLPLAMGNYSTVAEVRAKVVRS